MMDWSSRMAISAPMLWFLAGVVYGQGYAVEGRVTNNRTGLPVPTVTVYINGTSMGTITDAEGYFRIDHAILPSELIFSHVSFAPVRITLSDTAHLRYLEVGLTERIFEIHEATVLHRSLRKEYLERFKLWFLGIDYQETGAEILNDSVIYFETRENDQFSARAFAPIEIRLPATGYHLRVDLVHFNLNYREELGGYHCSILGYYYFTPIEGSTGKEERRRARARAEAYYNSRMHFCKSLYHNQLLQNGYQFERACTAEVVSGEDAPDLPYFTASYENNSSGQPGRLMLTRFACKNFRIKYSYRGGNRPADLTYLQSNPMRIELSKLTFLKDTVYIYPSGRVPENSLLFSGAIGQKGVAFMLPEEYIPSMQ